jgi:hypothetical protein
MNEGDNKNEHWLSEWYSKCRYKYIDLVGDFGGKCKYI